MANSREGRRGDRAGPRRLIAGLRVSAADEPLLDAVRPFFPGADTAGELAYRLWRRGLELTLAELAGAGAALPPGTSEEVIATLAAQRLALCLPLLRRTGRLAALGIAPEHYISTAPAVAEAAVSAESIDGHAGEVIAALGASDFL